MRPGYYVEGRYYAHRFNQAEARAKHLATEYGRPVDVRLLHADTPETVLTVLPEKKAA